MTICRVLGGFLVEGAQSVELWAASWPQHTCFFLGRPGIVDLAGLAGAAPGESDFVLGWGGGRIEVIQISFKSYPRGTGRPAIVDSAGLAGAAPGKSDFVLGWPKGRTEVI